MKFKVFLTKAKELSLAYYLPLARGKLDGFILFPTALTRIESLINWSRVMVRWPWLCVYQCRLMLRWTYLTDECLASFRSSTSQVLNPRSRVAVTRFPLEGVIHLLYIYLSILYCSYVCVWIRFSSPSPVDISSLKNLVYPRLYP